MPYKDTERKRQQEYQAYLRAAAFAQSEKARRAKNAPVSHDWSDECWEEMRVDHQWQEREADYLFYARGFPLADLVEEDSVVSMEDLLFELSYQVWKQTQGWRNKTRGGSDSDQGSADTVGATGDGAGSIVSSRKLAEW